MWKNTYFYIAIKLLENLLYILFSHGQHLVLLLKGYRDMFKASISNILSEINSCFKIHYKMYSENLYSKCNLWINFRSSKDLHLICFFVHFSPRISIRNSFIHSWTCKEISVSTYIEPASVTIFIIYQE